MKEDGNRPEFSAKFENIKHFWGISENRTVVGHGNFMFLRAEYGKVPILQTLILLKQ